MNPNCAHLVNNNADAATLCDWLITSGIRTLAQIDTGVEQIDFTSSTPRIETLDNTSGNGVPEAPEVYNAAIDVVEEEELRVAWSSSFDSNSFPYSNFIYENTSFRIPTLLTDRVSSGSVDSALITKIIAKISSIKEKLESAGLIEHTLEFNLALAKDLTDYIMATDGLNVENFVATHPFQEWTAVEALTFSHQADCTEYSMIFYELCRLAGFKASIAQVMVDENGDRLVHFCVALRLNPDNPDQVTLVDLTRSNPFLTNLPQKWIEIPKLSSVAYYHINLGLNPPRSIDAMGEEAQYSFAESEYQMAYALDPHLPLLHFNMGRLYYCSGQLDLAEYHFQRARELDPEGTEYLFSTTASNTC